MIKKLLSRVSQELPKTLQTPVKLENIGKIEYHHLKKRPGFRCTREFIKTWIPPMRYYNEDFIYKPVVSENKTPKFVIFNKENQIISELEPKIMEPEKILESIQKIDKEYVKKNVEKSEIKSENLETAKP